MEECRTFREDIVVEILCRLPKKSLARFKCVSKQWLALISDRNRISHKTSHFGLVFQTFLPLYFRPKPSSSTNEGITQVISQMNFLRVDNMGNASSGLTVSYLDNDNFYIIGSCGGFLLYRKERTTGAGLDLTVFHPATNRSWDLSVLIQSRGLHFGLASDGLHFKFAHFWCVFSGEPASGSWFFLDVFSSENEQWIRKECHLPSTTIPQRGNKSIRSAQSVFLDGSFHWIWTQYLVVYHLGKADCKLLKLPKWLPLHETGGRRTRYCQCIWESEGCVNYCQVSANGRRIGIWTLLRRECSYMKNEYSFDWEIKHQGVLVPPRTAKIKHFGSISPFAFNDDFDIVYLMDGKRVFSYSIATRKKKEACTSPFQDTHGRALCIALPFLYVAGFNTTTTAFGDRELRSPCLDKIKKRKYQRLL